VQESTSSKLDFPKRACYETKTTSIDNLVSSLSPPQLLYSLIYRSSAVCQHIAGGNRMQAYPNHCSCKYSSNLIRAWRISRDLRSPIYASKFGSHGRTVPFFSFPSLFFPSFRFLYNLMMNSHSELAVRSDGQPTGPFRVQSVFVILAAMSSTSAALLFPHCSCVYHLPSPIPSNFVDVLVVFAFALVL
jgi:hypothetical protein